MIKDSIFVDKQDSIATIYFNRPEKRNALNYDMWNLIKEIVNECEDDDQIRVIVFRGVDKTAFSAGADISEFKTLRNDAKGANKYNQATLDAEKTIMECKKPTIAMIQGFCVGGGCEISLACDFRFSDASGKFGITASKLGIVYNLPGTKNLVDLVGPSHAKDLLFSGRLIDTNEAKEMGLINNVYQADEIEEKTYKYAQMLSENAQFAMHGIKFVISEVIKGEVEDTEEVAKIVLESFESDDYREAVSAFVKKQPPKFK